jgi:hypothetical protein
MIEVIVGRDVRDLTSLRSRIGGRRMPILKEAGTVSGFRRRGDQAR